MLRIVLGALAGAVAVFVWGAVSWTVLDYHWKVVERISAEEPVVAAIQSHVPETGVYFYPTPPHHPPTDPTPAENDAWKARYMAGPVGMLMVTRPGSDPESPMVFARGLLINFLAALCASLLSSLAGNAGAGPGQRWFVVMLMAVFACGVSFLNQWNWLAVPETYSLVMCMDVLIGWAIGGIVIALIARGATRATR